MRDVIALLIPDLGGLMLLGLVGLVIWGLFCMCTDRRGAVAEPVEHDTTPLPPAAPFDPEDDARTRGF